MSRPTLPLALAAMLATALPLAAQQVPTISRGETATTQAADPLPVPPRETFSLSMARSDDYGPYLVGPDGLPVYVFLTDRRGGDNLPPTKSCLGPCREEWPLVPAPDELALGAGVVRELVGTQPDDAGPQDAPQAVIAEQEIPTDSAIDETGTDRQILTYDGRPLFLYYRDEPGEPPQGHGITTWGGWWHLVSPAGPPITEDTLEPGTEVSPEIPD